MLPSSSLSTTSLGAKSNAAPRNPVSLRLYKVLSTTYDDAATRDALTTLSEFYQQSTAFGAKDSPKGEDESDATAHRTEGEDAVAASGTAARARKSLRRDAESKVAQGSQKFLKAFKEVDKNLDILQTYVETMQIQCDEAHAQLQSTNQACKSLLERAGGLRSLRDGVADRQAAVDGFLTLFTLSESERDAIESRDIMIETGFFEAMAKAEKIRDDCHVLMAGEDGPTQAGTDIMSTTSQQLEQGFDKISRWCSLEFRSLGRDAQLEVGSTMREAIRWLRKRPELLSDVLHVLAQTRQATILSTFMDALTRGGPGGRPRPIEIHAHDPLRYVGDMLAWVHQAIAGEREFLESLFSIKGDGRMVGSVRTFDGGGEEEEWIGILMDNAFEKLCSPLKIRVRQTVRSQESCITSYKVANLLQFYTVTMRSTIGDKPILSKTLNEMTDDSYKAFLDTIEAQSRSLARTPLPEDQDVTPPLSILDHTQILRELMSVYQSALIGDENETDRREGFRSILDTMVDNAIEMCINSSDARVIQNPEWDKEVFMLNCVTHLQNVVKSHSFADYKTEALQNDLDLREAEIVVGHYHRVLRDAGLDKCVAVCEAKRPDEPISRVGAMQPTNLEAALRNFATWLSSPDVVQPQRLSRLLDQRLGSRIHRAALRRLANSYELICSEVRKPENKYEAANTTLGSQRPFGQMTALRQVLGIEEDIDM
ncbi:oligomeric complex COG6 [Rickenella mellea]|uniref:Conserved oligomeric Golgi complex subunit 6 n=1 Tax=Rickenella mellea TaxID=50990 RepID=A0A4Y7QKB7_9AGAM|nr:oligomeric complex COG6 [Rickenella mellea]